MNVATRLKIEQMEKDIESLKKLVDTLSNVVQNLQNRELTQLQSNQTLKLPEKRKSA
jgi:hypothetical protein